MPDTRISCGQWFSLGKKTQNGFVSEVKSLCAQNPVKSRKILKLKITIFMACKRS